MKNKGSKKYYRKRKRRSPLLPAIIVIAGFLMLGIGFLAAGRLGGNDKAEIEVFGSPKLVVDNEEIDLGDVPLGKTVEVSFKLTNAGDQPLRFAESPWIELVAGC